jgi:hypothetical protein
MAAGCPPAEASSVSHLPTTQGRRTRTGTVFERPPAGQTHRDRRTALTIAYVTYTTDAGAIEGGGGTRFKLEPLAGLEVSRQIPGGNINAIRQHVCVSSVRPSRQSDSDWRSPR